MKPITRSIAGIAALLLVLPLAQVGTAGKRKTQRTSQIAPGVTFTRIRDNSGPFRIRVITIDLSSPTTIDTVLAQDRLPRFETTSAMAQRSGAIAAINGDYARSSGRPVFAFAADGTLAQTELTYGRNFSTMYDESTAYIGRPTTSAWAIESDSGTTYPIRYVNRSADELPIVSTEVRMFTWQAKGDARPPRRYCLVRLMPQEQPAVVPAGTGTEQDFTVDAVVCDGLNGLRPQGGIVLAATLDSQYALAFQSLFPGDDFTIGWTPGWPHVLDTIGGNPTLVEAGQIISKNVDGCGTFCGRHPRTGVGTTPNGNVLFVTVDGRQRKYSVGMSLREFAEVFVDLGADYALNLDGGGSTTMVVDDRVVNRVSDKRVDEDGRLIERVERGVSSTLVLLPGDDPGEGPQPPVASPSPSPSGLMAGLDLGRLTSVSSPETYRGLWRRIATDPGSTGGMLDYLVRRGYRLPPYLMQTVRLFRSGR